MNCDPQGLIAYHYDEIAPPDKKRLEAHLTGCAACRGELDGLRATSKLLGAWRDEAPPLDIAVAPTRSPQSRRWTAWWTPRLGLGLAAALAAFVLLSASEFSLSYRDGALDLRLAFSQSQERPAPLGAADLAAAQKQTLERVAALIEYSQTRQQQQLDVRLNRFADQLHGWRQQDLQLLDARLRQYEWQVDSRFSRHEDVLQHLIPATYHPDAP